jgi:hypothetical protein
MQLRGPAIVHAVPDSISLPSVADIIIGRITESSRLPHLWVQFAGGDQIAHLIKILDGSTVLFPIMTSMRERVVYGSPSIQFSYTNIRSITEIKELGTR